MLARKILKDSLTKDDDYWNFIGKLLATCHQNDIINSDILQNV